MNTLIESLLSNIAGEGSEALIIVLLGIILALGWYCFRLMKQNEKKDDKIYKIINDYAKNNITITEALNGLKMVLIEIKTKL